MASLKQRTITGILWSSIDNLSNQGLLFLIGIILARLLTPEEYGLIGMITIFIAISGSFVNSGFSQALIRKKSCTDADLSTVFYFNIIAGTLFFGILLITAPSISKFFNEPQLTNLVRVLGLVLIIDALTIIQRTTLIKRIDFKLQTKITIISTVCSGTVGITMAYSGFGVWSLVVKALIQSTMSSLLLWFWNKWRPMLIFSKKSFTELFSFGYKLLFSGLIDTFYRNIYYVVIGKYFSAQELGFYTKADHFSNLPSKNINTIIARVSYPVLAQLQDDPLKLKGGYKKIIKHTMFITFILMAGLAAVAEPMIISLIGEKWRPSVVYLQLLCFVGALYPLNAINLNMLNVQGRSDLFLKLEIIKKTLAVPVIVIGIVWGVKVMILGMWFNTIVAYFINSYYSGRHIRYSIREQLFDIIPYLVLATFMGGVVFITGWLVPWGYMTKLIVQILLGMGIVVLISEWARIDAFISLKEILIGRFKIYRNGRK